jgi:hypothetical protein
VQPFWSAEKAFKLDTKAIPKIVGEFFEDLWQSSPSQFSLFFSARTFPLDGKDGLALWGQADAEKRVLKVQASK